ncbi:MAG: hypothetical protein A2V98_14330 [Planctomycetes bacterium RBG_16_64_12]|nr:MAG: hypothetical protein A2V98_14330 [Planctomycetes bacterium RBG_16_64_12]
MSEPFPTPVRPLLVWLKREWADDWEFQPEATVRGIELAACGHGDSVCELWRPYGPEVVHPWQSAFVAAEPWREMANAWVKVAAAGPGGCLPMFYGRVMAENNVIHGADRGPSGEQSWRVMGPKELLRRVAISESVWAVPQPTGGDTLEVRTLKWCPKVNDRDGRGVLVGNRTSGQLNGSYLFGGKDPWTNLTFLQYLLAQFVTVAEGPEWTVGGQNELLVDLKTEIDVSHSRTAADILDELIPRSAGLDYLINTTEDGFEIRVFPLNARKWSFAGKTLHANPNKVEITTGVTCAASDTQIATSWEESYSKIRVLGERIVLCTSLVGRAVGDWVPLQPSVLGTLWGKWAYFGDGGEEQYIAGYPDALPPSVDAAEVHDEYRDGPKFRLVYQNFGAPDSGAIAWDMAEHGLVPFVDDLGEVTLDGAVYQDLVRSTLNWTPLVEGWDYTTGLPGDTHSADFEPDLLPPAVYIGHVDPKDPWNEDAMSWSTAESLGIGVQASKTEWGVLLSVKPNHLLANLTGTAGQFTYEKTKTLPAYNWQTIVGTVAWKTDQRLAMVWEDVAAEPGRDGVKDIFVSGAQCWVLGPRTVLGLTDAGHFVVDPDGMVLRNDKDRLALVMAGAIARYQCARSRASITVEGLLPWAPLVGRILTVVENDGESQGVEAPVTSITWSIPESAESGGPRTTIKTGFAD